MPKQRNTYIVITHSFTPNKSENKKPDEGNWLVNESCEFVDEIKNRMTTDATVILDYTNKKVIKNRTESTDYHTIYDYIAGRYPDKIKQLKWVLNGKNNTN